MRRASALLALSLGTAAGWWILVPPGHGAEGALPGVPAPPPAGWREGLDCTTTGCHGGIAARRFPHGAIEEAGCEGCHDEAGPHRFEPVDTTPETCLLCHEGTGKLQWGHGDGGAECLDCHDPHGSARKRLLRMDRRALCQDCHGLGEGLPPERVHPPVRDGDCLACHHPHRVARSPLLARRVRETCRRCHRRIVDPVGREPDPHAALEDGEGCVNCHGIHEAEHPHLLDEPYPPGRYTSDPEGDLDLCFTCHDADDLLRSPETGFVDAQGRNLHGVHVLIEGKGRACRACHRMHETRLPHMLDPRPVMGKWHSRLELTQDADGSTCAPACHEPRSYGSRN